jgi:hypothetical protein
MNHWSYTCKISHGGRSYTKIIHIYAYIFYRKYCLHVSTNVGVKQNFEVRPSDELNVM